MRKLYIGQKVVCVPTVDDPIAPKSSRRKPRTGTIFYIHPARRWIVVDFGIFRESFFTWDVLHYGR